MLMLMVVSDVDGNVECNDDSDDYVDEAGKLDSNVLVLKQIVFAS